ncbi:MAG TPA: hypothetical protein VKB12_06415, partial [Pyrinomonadaceae bacterium]|nr:hypothetical protein [Pyrinomonadaceae bacterium]
MPMSRGRKIALIITGVVLSLVVLGGIVIVLIAMSLNAEPDIPDNSVLVLRVEGGLPDHSNADPLAARFFGANPNSLENLLTQLRK